MSKRNFFINYFKHIPDDLVINSTPGMIISLVGTIVMITLFFFELTAYFEVKTHTTLVVDELVDDMLRVNFNVTLHQVPCEFLSVDVSDMTGSSRHNISKDILKWRLDSQQNVIAATNAVAAKSAGDAPLEHETHGGAFDIFDPDEYEPPDTNLSEALTAESFEPFLKQHELTVVNFFAPWCIWCRRFEPVYLETAQKIPGLHFHGHARLSQVGRVADLRPSDGEPSPQPVPPQLSSSPPRFSPQVDCVANQAFCGKNMIRAYPTVRMYKDGDPVNFELFTGARTVPTLIQFIQTQMDQYKLSHRVAHKEGEARFMIKHGALAAGSDLYRARMDAEAAQTYASAAPLRSSSPQPSPQPFPPPCPPLSPSPARPVAGTAAPTSRARASRGNRSRRTPSSTATWSPAPRSNLSSTSRATLTSRPRRRRSTRTTRGRRTSRCRTRATRRPPRAPSPTAPRAAASPATSRCARCLARSS